VNLNRSLAGSKEHEEVPYENGSATPVCGKSRFATVLNARP